YTARVAKEAALGNPTVVVLSDRTELDKQLYEGFAASELLSGVDTIGSRTDLREKLATQGAGGIYFSTLQKFGLTEAEKKSGAKHPLLSNRRNVIVIADEAHRSHYGDLDGYARWLRQALPNATMIAFTGTPLSTADRDTRAVFGDYIDVYDLTRAANDGATVRVYFDSRLAPVDFAANVDIEELDEEVDEITLGLDDAERRSIEQRVATLNAVYGAPSRLDAIAADLVEHWESRGAAMAPLVGGTGKALLVCATREICGDMYDRIVALRPDWHDDADLEGRIKVVFSSSDPKDKQNPKLAKHIRRPAATDALKARIRALDDPLEIVIVQGMLLTGFDGPPLHTMYLDRPLKGATLMQALARVNRKCGEKQDGLLVGYAPVTENLHEALAEYTKADRENRPVGADIDEAIAKLRDEVGVVNTMLEGCRWRTILHGGGRRAGLNAILEAVNFLRDPAHADNAEPPGEHNLPQRFRLATQRLERFWALCSNDRKIEDLRDDIGFFRAVRIQLMRMDADARKAAGKPVRADIEKHLRMVADSVIEADGVKDIYAMAGVDLPDLTNINEDYLARLRASAHPHIAIEALRRLVEQEMRKVMRHNLVQRGRFSEALDELMRRYTNQNLDSAQIIAELVAMARDIVNERDRGNSYTPPLDREEIAFYDAVATNESAILQMGTDTLADIARDLVKTLRRDLKTDWSVRADVRAKMRSTIRRLLMRHGYPPDQQPAAVQRVIQQMETFAGDWAPAADHRD
ncbi:MAG: type I restriction endonuclease subunit R, partial [Gaiellaceae bacterium]